MKKIMRVSVAIMLLMINIGFVACKKTKVETAPEKVKNEVKNNLRNNGGFTRQETYSGTNFIGCPNNGVNCFWPPVEVCGNCTSHIPVLEEVFNVVQSGNNAEIAEIFALYRDILIEYYHEEYIDGIIEKTYTAGYSFYNNAHYIKV